MLMKNPDKINLDEVVPSLVRLDMLVGALHVCLVKANAVNEKQREEIMPILEAWFWALNRSYEGSEPEQVKKDEATAASKRYY